MSLQECVKIVEFKDKDINLLANILSYCRSHYTPNPFLMFDRPDILPTFIEPKPQESGKTEGAIVLVALGKNIQDEQPELTFCNDLSFRGYAVSIFDSFPPNSKPSKKRFHSMVTASGFCLYST
mgnify:CR=1 FL=1